MKSLSRKSVGVWGQTPLIFEVEIVTIHIYRGSYLSFDSDPNATLLNHGRHAVYTEFLYLYHEKANPLVPLIFGKLC